MEKTDKNVHIDLGPRDATYLQFKAVAGMMNETIPAAVKTAMSLYLKKYAKRTIFSIDTNN